MQEQTIQEDGFFSGYLAVFDNVDSHGDVIRKGAFLKTIEAWKLKGKYPAIFWDHNPSEPIGIFTLMQEDDKGLYVEGWLLIKDVPRAQATYALMKVGAIDGMSIGYITKLFKRDPKTNIRELLELELVEGSIVAFPSNPETLINSVKSKLDEGELPTLPEFEKFLRESGFSKSEDEKRARRNALAQRLVGSQLVSFELVDYLIKNKNINNFEIVAKTLALWDTSLKIDRNDDKKITGIGLNTWGFRKEKLMLIITLLFSIFMLVFSIYIFKYNVIWLKSTMMLPEYISIIAMILLVLGFIALAIFLCITTIILFDLKRIVVLINK